MTDTVLDLFALRGRVLRDLDRFLNTRLSVADPLVTPAVVHDYVARRGTESETTRAHQIKLTNAS